MRAANMRSLLLPLLFLAGCGQLGLEYAAENTADMAIEPATGWDFGVRLPEHEASVHNFTLRSAEDERGTYVEDVWLEGDTGSFVIAREPELPTVIEPGKHGVVVVRFRPEETGNFRTVLKAVDGNGGRYRVELIGEGCRNRDGNRRCD